jgi:hypothetical protein
MRKHMFVAAVFVIGCMAGGAASQLAVPPVRAGTAPTKWEYFCGQADSDVTAKMNTPGQQGWELVSVFPAKQTHLAGMGERDIGVSTYGFCFKRALP